MSAPRTLVDCGCEAAVYEDGSGVEIEYCAKHEAAPGMYEALRDAADALMYLLTQGWTSDKATPEAIAFAKRAKDCARAALAKADGKVTP